MKSNQTTLHATSVAINGRAVLISGPSGSGKSSLALQLMALGAGLIADDQTLISVRDGTLWADKPPTLPSFIEARGIGLLPTKMVPAASVALLIDLERNAEERCPSEETESILGQMITVWRNVAEPHFPAAIFVYLSSMPEASTPDT